MSRLDIVIFGATGYTGRNAAVELARIAQRRPGLAWGVAGRSQTKLEDLLKDVASTTGVDTSAVRILVADVKDEESLSAMCSATRVLASCCGPYRLYGEPVVRAAVRAGTHYVDVTGEPQFIETMQVKYDAEARAGGVCVVSACGYDSVPNDMGVVYLQRHFGGTLNSVESYMSSRVPPELSGEVRAHGAVHSGTWDSLVLGLAHWEELKPLRKKLFPEPLPPFKPKLMPRGLVHSSGGRSCVPFPGADNSIVYRTQRRLYEEEKQRPVQFRAYLKLESLLQAIVLIVGGIVLAVMAKFTRTRELLLRHPRFFSAGFVTREGPTPAVCAATRFMMELRGSGWSSGADVSTPPDKTVVARVSGVNPGYGATVVMLLYCALAILDERDNMPPEGGVLTTGVAFRNTSLIKNLQENGVKFEIVETSTA